MELAIAIFIGVWLSAFSVWGYFRIKKEYKDVLKKQGENQKGE